MASGSAHARIEGQSLPERPELQWVGDIPARGLAHCPQRTAVLFADADRHLRYDQMERMTRAFAEAMRVRGIGWNTRVAYLGRNHELFMPVLFGVIRARCVLVPLNWRLTAPEIAYQLQDSGATLLIVDAELMPVARKAIADLGTKPELLAVEDASAPRDLRRLMTEGAAPPSTSPRERDQVILQMYTSGTTGKPKGVQITHGCVTYARYCEERSGSYAGWNEGSIHLSAMPNFHIGGLSWMLIGLIRLSTMVLTADPTPANILRLMEQHRPGRSFIVPTVIRALVDAIHAGTKPAPRLEQIVYGASAIGESLLRDAMETFGCRFGQAFGMTEVTGTCTYLHADEHDLARPQLLKSVGRPLPGMAIEIRDAQGQPLGLGEAGEIWVRTPTAMLGYWNLPKATEEALVDGWYRTGDGGRVDPDGFLYLTDRIKDMIISGGENVYPVEVEERLRHHPAVLEAAVVGLPDPKWGETVHAMIELRPGESVEPEALLAFAREGLAGFKCPRSVRFTQALPRTASGKVQRAQVRAQWRAEA